MNNNPDIFTRDARPIVEFSIENKKAVNAREKRLEKSRENNPNFKGGKGAKQKDPKKNEFKRPGQKEVIEDKADFMGTINNPKQRSLPSHMGPKVRHNRPNTAISRKDIKKAEKNQKMKNKRKNPSSAGAGEASDISDIPPAKAPRLNGSSAGGNNGAAQGASGEVKSKKNRKKKKFSKAATHDYREEKQFTELVNKYRVKLDPGQGGLPLRNKWFEG